MNRPYATFKNDKFDRGFTVLHEARLRMRALAPVSGHWYITDWAHDFNIWTHAQTGETLTIQVRQL